jgi:hypothetical protein
VLGCFLVASAACCNLGKGDIRMIDLDELGRRMHEAFRLHTDMDEWRDAVLALNDAIRVAAPELIAMARRCEQMEQQLRAERARNDGLIRVLSGIHAMLYPPRFAGPDGKVMEFRSPLVHEQMQELSDRIRAIPDELRAMEQKP